MDASVMQGTRTIIGNLRSVRKE